MTTKALIQAALKLPGTTSLEIHQYGRQLLAQKIRRKHEFSLSRL